MNYWTKLSIEYANQRHYLDDLFVVYPTIPEGIRDIEKSKLLHIERAFKKKDNIALMDELLDCEIFPIKDSYVAYLKRDQSAIKRNPATVSRLCGRLYEMGLDKIFERCSEPKETNRQIGPLFKRWLKSKALGVECLPVHKFLKSKDNAILDGSDADLMAFARERLNYTHNKGLDMVARFNGKYIIAEAKFLTDFGGHQNAQFADALSTLEAECSAIKVGILDGVLYIHGKNKMYSYIVEHKEQYNIMSALVLRDFLYQV
ncbi:MAG: restriction endonuclease [Phycisphaerae bacterium]|jgi:hypothetical protein